jgi:hypothetical protein
MKYPTFAAALRRYGSPTAIILHFGWKRRQVFEYLAGRSLPRAEKLLRYPDLLEAARCDVEAAQPQAA